MTTLVTGATGNVGRLVVRRLLAAGERVRAVSRTPAQAGLPNAVEVVAGDLTAPDSLLPALAGVDRLYLFPEPSTAREVVARAREAGVRRVVTLSSGSVTMDLDESYHLPVEHAVEASGLEWTHVRPGEFMMNKLHLWGPSIRTERVVREPFPEAAWYPVHEGDTAEVAAAALLEDGHNGRAYTLNGPELITRAAQVAALSAAIGEEIRLERVTPVQARELYRAQGGFAAENADFLLGFEDYEGHTTDPDGGDDGTDWEGEWDPAAMDLPTLADALGKPARTFAQWAADHAEDFR